MVMVMHLFKSLEILEMDDQVMLHELIENDVDIVVKQL
jgi:hypothetical protein